MVWNFKDGHEHIRDDGDNGRWARVGRGVRYDEGGQHVAGVVGTAMSRRKGHVACVLVYRSRCCFQASNGSLAVDGSFRGEGSERRYNEGPRGGWYLTEIPEPVNVGNGQGDRTMRSELGDWSEDRVNEPCAIVFIAAAGVGTVCDGWWGNSRGILLE